MANTTKLVVIRMAEEITEAGSVLGAIHAVERQIASPESVPAERAFMRKVLIALRTELYHG